MGIDQVETFKMAEYVGSAGSVNQCTDRNLQLKLWAFTENEGTGIISEAGFRIQFEYETTTGAVLKCKSTQDQSFQIFSEDAQWKMAIGENMTAIFKPYSAKLTAKISKKKPRNK